MQHNSNTNCTNAKTDYKHIQPKKLQENKKQETED